MTFAVQWNSPPPQPRLTTILTGTVVARGEKVTGSGSVYNGQGGVTVSSRPDIWLRDDRGQEHRIEDHLVGDCRAGHRVAVFWERHGKQRLIAMANLSTGQWYGRPNLMVDSTIGTVFAVGLFLAIALAIPCMILWVWFLIAVAGINLSRGTPDWYWSGWMILVGSSAMFLSWKIQTGHDRTRRALRAEISAAITRLKAERSET